MEQQNAESVSLVGLAGKRECNSDKSLDVVASIIAELSEEGTDH